MLIYDTLDKIAEAKIPSGKHKYLHVNSREAWVDVVVSLYEKGLIEINPNVVQKLLNRWESLLYNKYSQLN